MSRTKYPPELDEDLFRSVEQFLYEEAELLDDNDLSGWLSLLADDIEYKVPVRTTKERFSESTFSKRSYFINDDYSSLSARVERLNTDFAWSEDPPSRTRRLVTNIRIKGRNGDDVSVENSLLIQRNQGDTEKIDLLTAEREDTIRIVGNELELASRTVYLDHTVLDTDSLSIFL